MMKKSNRMRKTLTSGWIQAAERPSPGGGAELSTLVQVKLSNKELIHSLGISWRGGGGGRGRDRREGREREEGGRERGGREGGERREEY